MPTASSRNLIGSLPKRFSQFRKYQNLVALTAYLRVVPREETFGDKLVRGITNLGMRLKNNIVFNRGELLGEFQMIRREAFTRLGGFGKTSLPLKTPIGPAGWSKSEKP